MYPAVRELKAEFGTQVAFVIADTTERETGELVLRFNVRTIPHFVMISATGREQQRVGGMSKETLRSFLLQGLDP
jgi:thioredoxin-related protein